MILNLISLLVIGTITKSNAYCWLTKEAVEWMIEQFEIREKARQKLPVVQPDRRSSSPFITGAGFREACQQYCDDSTHSHFNISNIHDGDFLFVNCFRELPFILPKINVTYTVVAHYSLGTDQSSPDGQTDFSPGLGPWRASDAVRMGYMNNKLLAFHAVNLWWYNYTINQSRPAYLHCLPLGIENRQPSAGSHVIGKHPEMYAEALKKSVLHRKNYSLHEERSKPLLLVTFVDQLRSPDRKKVLDHLRTISKEKQRLNSSSKPFYHTIVLYKHADFLAKINEYRFVLAPFGHGLDTFRLYEILLMGGIPVMRQSSMSSCYDDSDNFFNGHRRGSLPVVILESWKNLTEDRLEWEWNRIVSYPKKHWDWRRLTLDHWLERIGLTN